MLYHTFTESLPDSQKRRWLTEAEDWGWLAQIDNAKQNESDLGTGEL